MKDCAGQPERCADGLKLAVYCVMESGLILPLGEKLLVFEFKLHFVL